MRQNSYYITRTNSHSRKYSTNSTAGLSTTRQQQKHFRTFQRRKWMRGRWLILRKLNKSILKFLDWNSWMLNALIKLNSPAGISCVYLIKSLYYRENQKTCCIILHMTRIILGFHHDSICVTQSLIHLGVDRLQEKGQRLNVRWVYYYITDFGLRNDMCILTLLALSPSHIESQPHQQRSKLNDAYRTAWTPDSRPKEVTGKPFKPSNRLTVLLIIRNIYLRS